jgi:hypothetical protein
VDCGLLPDPGFDWEEESAVSGPAVTESADEIVAHPEFESELPVSEPGTEFELELPVVSDPICF